MGFRLLCLVAKDREGFGDGEGKGKRGGVAEVADGVKEPIPHIASLFRQSCLKNGHREINTRH